MSADPGVSAARPSPPPRRPAGAWLLATGGAALLVWSLYLPWVRLQVGPTMSSIVLRQPGTVTVQTYGVTALPGAVTMLVADWSALLALLVLSWRVPRWRRRLVGITIVVLSVLLLLTLGEGQTAVAASGLARQYPDTELLPGAWLALLGAGLIGGAIAVPATPRPLAASQSDQPSGDPIAIVGPARGAPASPTVTEPEPASPMPPTAGWSVRPVRQPWWRRPGPRIALLTGAAAVVLVIGAVAWLAVQTPAAPRDHSGDLRGFLLPLPPGATLSAIDGQLDAASIDDNPIAPIAVQQGGIQQIAVERWLETSGQGRVSVGLVRFDSDNRASQVLSGFLLLKGGLSGQPRVEDVPGLRGVTSFDNGSEAVAIGARGDVLFVIAYVGPDASPSSVDTFARDQYDLL